ncbi:hypothetical protein FF38_11170 [Lucilia cuprina]|uniref:Uncharacterized protein n=1 Tax=Lucilia cuprina TaxID=7375 RepID=A0A0L0BXZ5_LUCCU|nr:hypothetical protein FF38_11170 [Lucilia cuprina]
MSMKNYQRFVYLVAATDDNYAVAAAAASVDVKMTMVI